MLKQLSLVLILWIFGVALTESMAQAPDLECVSVINGSDAVLTFEGVPASAGFVNYEFFHAANAGATFTSVATNPNAGAISQSIVGGADFDLDNASGCFYFTANYNDGTPTVYSDTLCSIFLEVDQSNPPGFADLDWNSPNPNGIPPNTAQYEVQMEFPAGTWTTIGTVSNAGPTDYSHEVSVCGEFLNFRIRLVDVDCNMMSNVDGDIFTDTSHPGVPTIQSVDVDSVSGNAVINWSQTGAGDTNGYIIYLCDNGSNIFLDTVWGINTTQYEYLDSQANLLGSESFLVASFDTCYTGNPPQPNISPTSGDCFTSIFLQTQWQACQEFVNLSWNPVNGWENGVDYYEIYAAEGNAPFGATPIDVVEGDVTTYDDYNINLDGGGSYRYYIKAFSNSPVFDQISNIREQEIPYDGTPEDIYLQTATVLADNVIQVDFYMTPVDYPLVLILDRMEDEEDGFEAVASQIVQNQANATFLDTEINAQEQSYTYRIRLENSCDDPLDTTNIGKTIFASGFANTQNLVNNITWNGYEDWSGEIVEHVIYRSQDQSEMPTQFDVVGGGKRTYEDDVTNLLLAEGEFCYIIEAVESTNEFGFAATSRSNKVCVTQEPKIWIPNAFVVNGVNNIFKPVISFADFDNYRLIIYNRWGQEIYETTDYETGWNGRQGGKILQEGQYMYYMSITDGFGNIYERRGPVMLLVGGQ